MFDINQFLQNREDRVVYQNSLISKYNLPLLTVRTNYPGENKNEIIANNISDIISHEIELLFEGKIIYRELIHKLEGKIHIFIINDTPKNIKFQTMYLEETHILGRCVDIDVYDCNGNGISRQEFGKGKRKCMLCDDLAFVCGRTLKHSHNEIKEYINQKYIEFKNYELKAEQLSSLLSDIALEGMIYEVSSFPSFGLVSPLSNGSHNDMNFFTFLDSSFVLKNGFKEMAKIIYSALPLDIAFKKLRIIGQQTEEQMFKTTNNVNTHKGMIFLLGIAISCTARAIFEKKEFHDIQSIIQEMTKDILKDFDKIDTSKPLTHGEKLFLEHGFTGIRGEIQNGLEVVFKGSLPIFNKTLTQTNNFNLTAVQTLIFLMSKVMDSTIVYRHDFETLHEVKTQMENIFNDGGIFIENSTEFFNRLEKEYIGRRISPGGSADLLAITIFFYKVHKIFDNLKVKF